jgi:hypothetical protein
MVRRPNLSPTTKLIVNLGLAAAVLVTMIVLLTYRPDDSPAPSGDDQAGRLERLRSLPYTAVTGHETDPDESGVRIAKAGRFYEGYNLYCSRVAPEAYLMDMTGSVVHTWSRPGDDIWVWDHAVMQPNGDVIVINKFRELLRLAWDSEIVWRRDMDVHHDVAVLPDGTFYAIIRGAELYRGLIVRFPSIVHFTPEGTEIDRWYTHDHLDEIKRTFDPRSFLDTILDSALAAGARVEFSETVPGRIEMNTLKDGRSLYDYFHLNTITILPETPLGERDSRFGAGNLLVCLRNVNQIAILEKDTWKIVWVWGEGVLEWPHHPTMLDDGSILVFDNGVLRESSRVLEVDPRTGDVTWEYVARPPETFYTYQKGSAQRLPNGNTLICDGDNGRAFEVTRDGEIVWEWLNPAMLKEHRVQLYRIERLAPDVISPLLP